MKNLVKALLILFACLTFFMSQPVFAETDIPTLCNNPQMEEDTIRTLNDVIERMVNIIYLRPYRNNEKIYRHEETGNIFDKKGDTYYVLTTEHQVKSKKNTVAYFPTHDKVAQLQLIKRSPELDLALWSFTTEDDLLHDDWLTNNQERSYDIIFDIKAYILGYPVAPFLELPIIKTMEDYRQRLFLKCIPTHLNGVLYD